MKLHRPDLIAALLLVFGGILRFVRIDVPGLWIDEGYTILFTRMSWSQVLGLQGAYDSHPPLYFATAKLFGLILPEVVAGRMVSVVAGTLVLPALYLLAKRISNSWTALAALAALAFSPLHIWYSRDARMYACAMLFVVLSYLAAVEFSRTWKKQWAVLYGASVLFAMYFSYSSFYALVPQPILLYIMVRRDRRRSLPILVSLAAAIAAYAPWIPQWLAAIQDADPSRQAYLGVSAASVAQQLIGVAGLADRGYYQGLDALPWETWPVLNWLFALVAVSAFAIGLISLRKESKLALLVAASLACGTILVVIALSVVSPGFASRTILVATSGWAIIVGAAALQSAIPAWLNKVGRVSYALVLVASFASLYAIYTASERGRWQDMASDLAAITPSGQPVLIVRPVDYALIDVYQPHILDSVMVTSTAGLTASTVWFAYHDSPKFEEYHAQLRSLGYERIQHKYYYNPLYLDEYVKQAK